VKSVDSSFCFSETWKTKVFVAFVIFCATPLCSREKRLVWSAAGHYKAVIGEAGRLPKEESLRLPQFDGHMGDSVNFVDT
jgi:hypothetical protein